MTIDKKINPYDLNNSPMKDIKKSMELESIDVHPNCPYAPKILRYKQMTIDKKINPYDLNNSPMKDIKKSMELESVNVSNSPYAPKILRYKRRKEYNSED